MRSVPRRAFLQGSAVSLAALTAAVRSSPAREDAAAKTEDDAKKPAANEVVNVAVCGVHGRGMDHVGGFIKLKDQGVRIVAICDPDETVIGPAMTAVTAAYGEKPAYHKDMRRIFDNNEIDAVSFATPNHWHALGAIWACQAGKDVYVEKPVSHNVWEGRKIVEAARKYERIVQTGTQCRSSKGLQDAVAFLRSGKLGTVYMAKGLCYKPRGSIGHKDFTAVPPTLDYNLWTGPAAFQKPGDATTYNPNILHYNWHWVWNTGNGDLGNQGIHQMDLARWGLGKTEFPRTVQSAGGRYGYDDDGETANTQTVQFEYDDALLQFEVRGLPTNDEQGVRIGDIFYGTEGIMTFTSYQDWQTFFGPKLDPGPKGSGGGNHYLNFLEAVRNRDPKHLAAEIEEGHQSSALCHLGNIALKLGCKLRIDASTETFGDDAEANALLRREYRAPFVVPESV